MQVYALFSFCLVSPIRPLCEVCASAHTTRGDTKGHKGQAGGGVSHFVNRKLGSVSGCVLHIGSISLDKEVSLHRFYLKLCIYK